MALTDTAIRALKPGPKDYKAADEQGLYLLVKLTGGKMKARLEHVVPLAKQALALLETLRGLTGDGKYVFPSIRTPARPMSENTVNAALRRLGYTNDDMTAHGFRAMASTLLNESGKWSSDAIERALAHKDKDTVRAAYHRGAHWAERVEMAQWWADYLDTMRKGAEIVQLARARWFVNGLPGVNLRQLA